MKPVLILDCDEVILHFVLPFADWLRDRHDIELRFESFSLLDNMRHGTGEQVTKQQFYALLDRFFVEGPDLQPPVEQALETLERLSATLDLVVLTNIPARFLAIRKARLMALGLCCPVHSNEGPKGRMVRQLAHGRLAVFVDDLPSHLESAARLAPEVGRLHMVAEPAFRALVPEAPEAHARVGGWAEAGRWIEAYFERTKHGR